MSFLLPDISGRSWASLLNHKAGKCARQILSIPSYGSYRYYYSWFGRSKASLVGESPMFFCRRWLLGYTCAHLGIHGWRIVRDRRRHIILNSASLLVYIIPRKHQPQHVMISFLYIILIGPNFIHTILRLHHLRWPPAVHWKRPHRPSPIALNATVLTVVRRTNWFISKDPMREEEISIAAMFLAVAKSITKLRISKRISVGTQVDSATCECRFCIAQLVFSWQASDPLCATGCCVENDSRAAMNCNDIREHIPVWI